MGITYHPVSAGEKLLKVVKACNTGKVRGHTKVQRLKDLRSKVSIPMCRAMDRPMADQRE